MGTVHYSSPEQIEGRWVDGRSDQYGLACLAFRALTVEFAFYSASLVVLFAAGFASFAAVEQIHVGVPAIAAGAIAVTGLAVGTGRLGHASWLPSRGTRLETPELDVRYNAPADSGFLRGSVSAPV